jgi:hypothetical protein
VFRVAISLLKNGEPQWTRQTVIEMAPAEFERLLNATVRPGFAYRVVLDDSSGNDLNRRGFQS